MADEKISALPAAGALTGAEPVPIVQGGVTKKTTTQDIADLATPGVDAFSDLTDAYDLSTAPTGSTPYRTAAGVLAPIITLDNDPVLVDAVVTSSLSAYVYANGTAGVGATLTAGSNGAFPTQDVNVTSAANKRYLIRSFTGANRYKNGIYFLSTLGTGAVKAVLTRATDSDESSELIGQVVIPSGGSAFGRRVFSQATPATITVGTSPIVYNVASSTNNRDLQQVTDAGNTTDNDIVTTDGTNITTLSKTGVATDNGAGITVGFNSSPGQFYVSNGTEQTVADATSIAVQNLFGGTGVTLTSSGDVTASGVVRGNALQLQDLLGAGSKYYYTKVSIPAADIATLNTVPYELIANPGAGFAVRVMDVVVRLNYATAAYDDPSVVIIQNSSLAPNNSLGQFHLAPNVFTSSANTMAYGYTVADEVGGITGTLVENDNIVLRTRFSPGSTGQGTMDVYLMYAIITL